MNILLPYIVSNYRYAGSVSGENYENAVVFSGTVFQEVLIWKIKANINNEYSEVLHRLKGHKV